MSNRPLHIGLACGGTGGHIFPGLATADALRRQGHELTLWLSGKDIESNAVKDWEGPRITIPAEGFQHGVSLRSLRTAGKLVKAMRATVGLMRENRPDVVLAMGSYASVGPVYAALRLGVPVVLHEANVTPGRAVSLFARRATQVCACFEETRHYLRKVDLDISGFPLRREIEERAATFSYRPMPDGIYRVMVMGGSRGATPVNRIFSQAAVAFLRNAQQPVKIVHISGPADAESLQEFYAHHQVEVEVRAFEHDMARVYMESDLAICRAGAATCAELSAFGIPALLIPYPHAARDHQTLNADAMQRSGAADVVRESDLESEWLAEYLEGCMHTPSRLIRISQAARARGTPRAAEALAGVVVNAAKTRLPQPAGLA